MTRRVALAGVAALALVVSSVAAAAPPTRLVFTGDEENPKPAGTLCDFNYTVRFHFTLEITIFSDGRERWQWTLPASHINLDTGYRLTETSRYSTIYYSDHEKSAGLFFHLRDPAGKIVVVHAGQLYLSDTGVKFTPNSGGSGSSDYAAVVCPALGGHAVI
jgi:hypothetical protein